MAPRMNEVLKAARYKGVLIIHCPSDTMEFYKDHPGRKLAQQAPKVETEAAARKLVLSRQGARGKLPIDDSDGGCDCERTWKKGDPYPWTRQIAAMEIMDGDAITDSGRSVLPDAAARHQERDRHGRPHQHVRPRPAVLDSADGLSGHERRA